MKFLVLVLFALAGAASASAAYLPAGASALNLAYGAAPVQGAGLPFYPYGALGLGHVLPYGGLQSYPFPYVPALAHAPAAVAVSAAPADVAPAAPVAEQKSLVAVAPAAPAVPEVQPVDAPKPVEETPEVKQARESFMALWLAAAKAAADSPDTGDEPAPSRRRRDVTAVRSWGYGASWPSYSYSASPHVQSLAYPSAYPYYY